MYFYFGYMGFPFLLSMFLFRIKTGLLINLFDLEINNAQDSFWW